MTFLTEHGPALLFYLFAACALAGALGVVTLRNPMYGALSLLGTFLSVAALFLLRHAELLAIIQIFVYGGGIIVLFLFVIMLVNLHRLREERRTLPHLPAVIVLALLLVGLLAALLGRIAFGPPFTQPERFTSLPPEVAAASGNSQAVAWTLFQAHLLPFEIASLFLLIAMIGAVVLGRRRLGGAEPERSGGPTP
jgi:NADH-quinone oxidoreductase subunit J